MADPRGSGDAAATAEKGSLRGVNLLKDMPDEVVADLEKICRWETYGDGDLIFDRPDSRNDVYFIAKGRVRVVGHSKSGQEVAFVDLGAGQHFGELSAIDNSPRSATLYTLEDSLLAVTSGDAFIAYSRRPPARALPPPAHFAGTLPPRSCASFVGPVRINSATASSMPAWLRSYLWASGGRTKRYGPLFISGPPSLLP